MERREGGVELSREQSESGSEGVLGMCEVVPCHNVHESLYRTLQRTELT
jgi:hypothetical protein